MIITVVGSGYVGTTTAALLAAIGIKTYAVDIDESKVSKLKSGKAPFFEAGLDNLVAHGVETGNLIPTSSYEESVANSDIVMSAVGTPDNANGSPNLEYVFAALESIAKSAKKEIIYVQKSTVPVGTGKKIIEKFNELTSSELAYVSAPEFLREGTAVVDSIEPDRIVVGGNNSAANKKITDVFLEISKKRQDIAKIAEQTIKQTTEPTLFDMTIESAELTKVTANAFLALKISFANTIAKLADKTSADVVEVMDAVGADARIGRAFLNAGRGYGGGCFPKDVSGLISSANSHGVDITIMESAAKLNDSMPDYVVSKLTEAENFNEIKTVAVLGLAFKAGTSDVRKSPGIKIANKLSQLDLAVKAYDPEANEEASHELHESIELCDSLTNCIAEVDAIIIATEWQEFKTLEDQTLDTALIVDAMNLLDQNKVTKTGITYKGIGR